MSFRLELRPQASTDVFAAGAWYDEQEPGLGAEFALAVQKRLDELLENPLLPRLRDQVRRIRWVYPHRFPYHIIYRVIGETVLVIAIVHAARHDRYWKKSV